MDIGILEMKRKFCPLNTRRWKAPTENGCIENEVASKLFGIWGDNPSLISIPPEDMIGFVLFFICECPENERKELKCPYSLFTTKQVAPSQRNAIKEFAILREDVSLVALSLMRWYGSVEVFNVLRSKWTFNLDKSCLIHKGTFSRLIID